MVCGRKRRKDMTEIELKVLKKLLLVVFSKESLSDLGLHKQMIL